jgi:cell division protein ZipA
VDPLRLVLALFGFAIVVAIYVWGRLKERDRSGQSESGGLGAETALGEGFTAARDPVVSAAELDDLGRLRPDDDEPQLPEGVPDAPARRKAATPRDGGLVIALTVMAQRGRAFNGPALLEAMESVQMTHGEMSIFHRHDPEGESGALFSAANILEPGSFDIDKMVGFSTPGIVLFLRLPSSRPGLEVFEEMIRVGRALAEALGGELCDEARSTLTAQTIAHLRERIHNFENLPAHA